MITYKDNNDGKFVNPQLLKFAVWIFKNPYTGYDNAHDKVKQFLEQTK